MTFIAKLNVAQGSRLLTSLLVIGLGMGLTTAAVAQKPSQEPPKLEAVPDVPPPPRGGSNIDDPNEPTVTIRQEGDNKIEEFRINGRHYATRVTPKVGKPYLLVDPDGKGRMNPVDDVPARLRPPQWTLFQF